MNIEQRFVYLLITGGYQLTVMYEDAYLESIHRERKYTAILDFYLDII